MILSNVMPCFSLLPPIILALHPVTRYSRRYCQRKLAQLLQEQLRAGLLVQVALFFTLKGKTRQRISLQSQDGLDWQTKVTVIRISKTGD